MPNQDATGPQGNGPKTGRGFGRCGNGTGRGCGCSNGRRFLSRQESSQELEEIRNNLKADLAAVEEEIAEISK